ncbi:MAG: type I glutamate--ammonia ligase [Planctomycetes bacterium]|nr:type I glutamate--ammonia ligase [Planctomycetota bacterium]
MKTKTSAIDTKPAAEVDVLDKAHEVVEFARKQNIDLIDLKFVDLLGTWQHFTITKDELTEDLFIKGAPFDGSSIRGFQTIDESDMLVALDPTTAVLDPATEHPTLSLIGNIVDPVSGKPYTRDPRYVAQKAEAYLKKTGIADTSYWGPEIEFFVFDSVRFDQGQNYGLYTVDSDDGIWNSGRENNGKPNLGFRPRNKEGYFPCAPTDHLQELRSEFVKKLMQIGIQIEIHHAEVATAGQCEIDMKYRTLTKMADQCLWYKYVVRNVAKARGKTATFIPKPLYGDNGSGMHVHSSLWKKSEPLFFDKAGYAGMSDLMKSYIGGLLKHAPAILAFAAPTTNSYRRLVPGYEAPVNLAYSRRNRSAACRIPMYSNSPVAKRVEFRPPDPLSNPYLVFSAMLMAGLDGIQNKIDPGAPLDKDIYSLSPDETATVPQVPGSLAESIAALERDHAFLLKGDVFTPDVIEKWIELKRTREIDPVRLRPHPYEFFLYYDH